MSKRNHRSSSIVSVRPSEDRLSGMNLDIKYK